MDKPKRALHRAGAFLFVALASVLGQGALSTPARAAGEVPYEIAWAHSMPGLIERFVVFVSPVSGDEESARRLEVGKPLSRKIGMTEFYSTIISMEPDEYVAVAGLGYNGVLSGLSAWSSVPPSRPGQPLIVTP